MDGRSRPGGGVWGGPVGGVRTRLTGPSGPSCRLQHVGMFPKTHPERGFAWLRGPPMQDAKLPLDWKTLDAKYFRQLGCAWSSQCRRCTTVRCHSRGSCPRLKANVCRCLFQMFQLLLSCQAGDPLSSTGPYVHRTGQVDKAQHGTGSLAGVLEHSST